MPQEDNQQPTVYVVDDDEAVAKILARLMESVGLQCRVYQTGAEFLDDFEPGSPGCLVLDIRMPGISGIELQQELADRGSTMPIIFVTGYADVSMAVDAMQNGAFGFVEKPFRNQALLDKVNEALQADSASRSASDEKRLATERISRLSAREREVMELIVAGKANKAIAHELALSRRTVENHRARVMEKLEAKSVAELVRMFLTATG